MYLSHQIKWCQLHDRDAISWYTDGVKAAATGPSLLKASSSAARSDVSRDEICQLVRTFSSRDEFTFLAVISWLFIRVR